jgi:pimeloyl-ACP methyl ester carboxylesterase
MKLRVLATAARRCSWTLVFVAVLSACAPAASASQAAAPSPSSVVQPTSSATAIPSRSPSIDPLASPTIDRVFPIGADGHQLRLVCFGDGTPTLVFEAGTDSSAIREFPGALTRPLAETNQVCLYDRIGTGSSDPPTAERRTLDNTAADLDALLTAAGVHPPYVLVGQSGGGNIAVWYAVRHMKNVSALVLIDVGFDNPADAAKEFPGAQAWGGPEHIDWVDGARKEFNLRMPIGDFPVLILTADHGEPKSPPPSEWRKLTTRTREIVEPGGHDLHKEIPGEIANEIRTLLAQL